MNTLLTSPLAGWLLIGGVIAAIVALHRLKPRALRRIVASTLLWEEAAKASGQQRTTWRWWLSLGLSLLIGTLLAVALSRPEVQGVGEASRRVVVVVDNGPSMAARTRDGRTRWDHARTAARAVIHTAPGPVMVLDSTGQGGSTGFVAAADALAALERLSVAPAGRAAMPPIPSGRGFDVHVVTDGVADLRAPPAAIVHAVFEPADNVAVTGLVTRSLPSDPTKVEALVQIVNASPGGKTVRLSLRGGDRFTANQTIRMAAGERVDATFDLSAFEGGVLAAAAIASNDALPDDDIAYTVVASHRPRRVVLVSRGNAVLADSLASLPGVRVETVDPSRYRTEAGVDAVVFDGYTPPQAPVTGALLFRPGPAAWLPSTSRAVGSVDITTWDRGNAVTSGVAWNDVAVRQAVPWKSLPANTQTLVGAKEGGLVVAGRGDAPWIAVGFRPGDSNLPLQGGFPVFLGNAINALTRRVDLLTHGLGTIRVPVAQGEVRSGRGVVVASRHLGRETVFEAERPDLYTVTGKDRQVQVAAQAIDPGGFEINRSRVTAASTAAVAVGGLPLERWMWISAAALVLLLVEWAAYVRRITR